MLAADGKLNIPNGLAIDPDGNVVVVNIGNRDVVTYSPSGKVVRVEQSEEKGSDGIVIMARLFFVKNFMIKFIARHK